MRSNIMIIVY